MAVRPKSLPAPANDNPPRRDRRKGRAVSLEERLMAELMYAG